MESFRRGWRGGFGVESVGWGRDLLGLVECGVDREVHGSAVKVEAPSLRDSGSLLVVPFPPLKRWAN